MQHRLRVLPALALILALVAACTPTSATAETERLTQQSDGWYGLELDVERTLPSTTLKDTNGQPVNLAEDVTGTPTLLFFGYTSCPDICPIHLAAINSAMRTAEVSYDDLDVVFVSVDPERDTPEHIDDYLSNFSSSMVGLHADIEVVEAALDELDLPGPIVEGADPRGEGDLIGHPAQVIGFDSDGQAQRTWPFGARRGDWVSDLPRVVEEWT